VSHLDNAARRASPDAAANAWFEYSELNNANGINVRVAIKTVHDATFDVHRTSFDVRRGFKNDVARS
jgi:hypothetical protein